MASIMKQSGADIKGRLQDVTGVVTVETWNNQLERLQSGSTDVVLPGLFPERLFDPAINLMMGLKQTDFLLNIHIIHTQLDAGDGTRSDNVDIYDLRDDVVRKFTGFKPTGCGVLQYVNEQADFNHNQMYHYIVTYKAAMVDTTGTVWDDDNGRLIVKDPPTNLNLTAKIGKPYLKNKNQ